MYPSLSASYLDRGGFLFSFAQLIIKVEYTQMKEHR